MNRCSSGLFLVPTRSLSKPLTIITRLLHPPLLPQVLPVKVLPSVQDSELDSNKRSDCPSEEDSPTPKAPPIPQNPKYQLVMNSDLKTNGLGAKEADGPTGGGSAGENSPRLSRWETTRLGADHYRGSLESLTSRDWDTGSDRVSDRC